MNLTQWCLLYFWTHFYIKMFLAICNKLQTKHHDTCWLSILYIPYVFGNAC